MLQTASDSGIARNKGATAEYGKNKAEGGIPRRNYEDCR